jgi:hypothetical protein
MRRWRHRWRRQRLWCYISAARPCLLTECSRNRTKNEPGTTHIENHRRFTRRIYFVTHPAHVNINQVGCRDELVAPDFLEKHRTCQQLVASAHHVFEETKLTRQQIDFSFTTFDGALDQIEL